MQDDSLLFGWSRIVDHIIRGDRPPRQAVVLGPTPECLIQFGLPSGSLSMTVAKVAKCRREHPEIPLSVWHALPDLLDDPLAILPSARRDGSVVVLLIAVDRDQRPVIVAIAPDSAGSHNVVLSVYGKERGMRWVEAELANARRDGLPTYEKNGLAASMPQPPAAETASSSHGLIPSDGTTKPARKILSIADKSTGS